MFGTVMVPPAAETVGSIDPTSHVAATRSTPPAFGVSPAGSGNWYGYGRFGSWTSIPSPAGSSAASPPPSSALSSVAESSEESSELSLVVELAEEPLPPLVVVEPLVVAVVSSSSSSSSPPQPMSAAAARPTPPMTPPRNRLRRLSSGDHQSRVFSDSVMGPPYVSATERVARLRLPGIIQTRHKQYAFVVAADAYEGLASTRARGRGRGAGGPEAAHPPSLARGAVPRARPRYLSSQAAGMTSPQS